MRTLGQILFVILCLGVAAYAFSFLDFEIKGLLLDKGRLLYSPAYRLAFYMHVFFGGVALAIGPFQFFPRWRARRMKWHRRLGRLYVLSCLLSGIAGLTLAVFASGAWSNSYGFGLLAVGWLVTTSQAYRQIRKKRIEAHRRWMIRSFALTLAAVTLRLYLPALTALGLSFFSAYMLVSWLCWIPNLLIAEWIIRYRLNEDTAAGANPPAAAAG